METSRDADRLRRVAALLDVAGAWDQSDFGRRGECGTTACGAGWTIIDEYGDRAFAGDDDPVSGPGAVIGLWNADGSGPIDTTDDAAVLASDTIADHAQRLLGLSYDEASWLFSGAWKPRVPGRAGDAWRALADGASMVDVSIGEGESG